MDISSLLASRTLQSLWHGKFFLDLFQGNLVSLMLRIMVIWNWTEIEFAQWSSISTENASIEIKWTLFINLINFAVYLLTSHVNSQFQFSLFFKWWHTKWLIEILCSRKREKKNVNILVPEFDCYLISDIKKKKNSFFENIKLAYKKKSDEVASWYQIEFVTPTRWLQSVPCDTWIMKKKLMILYFLKCWFKVNENQFKF